MRTARRWGEHCVSVGWNLSESWSFFPSVWRFISKKTASFFEENREFFRRKPRGFTQASVILHAFGCVVKDSFACHFVIRVFTEFWTFACRVCSLFERKPRVSFEENRTDLRKLLCYCVLLHVFWIVFIHAISSCEFLQSFDRLPAGFALCLDENREFSSRKTAKICTRSQLQIKFRSSLFHYFTISPFHHFTISPSTNERKST